MPLRSVLLLAHVVGLALGVGAATVKLVLLLAPTRGAAPSPAFAAARSRFIVVEAVATGMFYGAMVIGVLL